MNEQINEIYANLPDDLLEEILKEAPKITDKLLPLFENIKVQKGKLRESLIKSNIIKNVGDLETPSSPSVAAIDGGQAIEKSIGADTLIAVAVGVEGLIREDNRKWTSIQYKNWQDVLPHDSESNPKIVRGAMTALELLVISGTPHDVIIADGSHQTPIIGINSLTSMSTLDSPVLMEIMLEIINKFNVVHSLKTSMENPNVIYMVKYDSSQDIGQTFLKDFELKVDDKTTMSMILNAGEYTQPLPVGQTDRTKKVWEDLYISISSKINFKDKDNLKSTLNEAIRVPKTRRIYFTYYKPKSWSPAYRIELKETAAKNEMELAKILEGIKQQVVSTEIQEPYPQFLADIMAKSISNGLEAIRAVVQSQFGDNVDYLKLITQSYRTY